MNKAFSLLIGLVSGAGALAPALAQAELVYQVTADKKHPEVVTITADTSGLQSLVLEAPRSQNPEPDLPKVECQVGEEWQSASWGETIRCNQLRWMLSFEKADAQGYDASSQMDTYHPENGWYLLTEWDSLPRIQGVEETKVCFEEQCQPLPGRDQAPLFMVSGLEKTALSVGKQVITLQSDVKALAKEQQTWQPVMERQLRYLRGVFHARAGEPVELVALGREVSSGSVGGASGNRIFLTNVPLEEGTLTEKSLPHFLKITAHETLHFISGIDYPLWLSESLAEYYAQKSLSDTEYAHPEPVQVWRAAAKKLPDSDTGLYTASRKVVDGQMQYYPLFYLKGAAFWLELDLLLQRKGSSLDRFIPALKAALKTVPPQRVSLPDAFVEQVTEVTGKSAFRSLEKRYLLTVNKK